MTKQKLNITTLLDHLHTTSKLLGSAKEQQFLEGQEKLKTLLLCLLLECSSTISSFVMILQYVHTLSHWQASTLVILIYRHVEKFQKLIDFFPQNKPLQRKNRFFFWEYSFMNIPLIKNTKPSKLINYLTYVCLKSPLSYNSQIIWKGVIACMSPSRISVDPSMFNKRVRILLLLLTFVVVQRSHEK